MKKDNMIRILNVSDVADLLSMKVSWVRQRVHREEIPYYKIGNLVRFNYDDIAEWLRSKKEI